MDRRAVEDYEKEKERKRQFRLMYHTEEEVKALEARDLDVENERTKPKDDKKKE